MLTHHPRPEGLGPVNGYSHVVTGTGRLVAISGQLPTDQDGTLVDVDDAFTQARQVFANLGRALQVAGAHRSDLIRLTYFLTALTDLAAVRAARDEFLGDGPPPTSSLVQVAGLVVPGARVEIDALAMTDG